MGLGDAFGQFTDALGSIPGAATDWFSGAMMGPGIAPAVNPTYDWTKYDQGAQQNQDLAAMLQQRAQGKGPSVADEQMKAALAQQQRAQASAAASARGGAMQQQAAQRNAQNLGAQQQMQGAQAAMMGRAAEAQGATGQLAGVLGQQQAMEQSRQLGMGQQQLGAQGQQMQGQIAAGQQYQQGLGNILGGIQGGAGIAALMSDERAKQDIHDAHAQIEDFLSHLAGKNFEYRPGMGPPGEQYGVMAQDLEKSPMGAAMVEQGPDGLKRVDTAGKLPMALLAALADMHGRMQKAGI